MKFLKISILVLSLMSGLYGFSYIYKGHFVATTSISTPRYQTILEEDRSNLYAMDTDLKIEFMYLLSDAIGDFKETSRMNQEFHDRNFKVIGILLLVQIALVIVALALNKPLLLTRKKPLAKE